ncbi:ComEA family DNA-binding protein [Halobacillus fulvus]|nr:ComEA family DNA-binding protein [Halobacillus fulvus]
MDIIKRYSWIIVVVVLGIFLFVRGQMGEDALPVSIEQSDASVAEKIEQESSLDMKVDVKGEVSHPGVYEVRSGMRVNDVIDQAGGLTDRADPSSINLAQVVQDEMVITVLSFESVITDSAGGSSDSKVAINQATVEEIQTLPGIGPSKAEAIIQYREENGPYRSAEDLLNVSGIGEATLNKLEEAIRVP